MNPKPSEAEILAHYMRRRRQVGAVEAPAKPVLNTAREQARRVKQLRRIVGHP